MACTNLKIITTTLYNYRLNVIHFLLSQSMFGLYAGTGSMVINASFTSRSWISRWKSRTRETPEEAAVREVHEETGGIVSDLTYLGQYKVSGKDKIIIKNIYFATISAVEQHTHYEETKGSVLLKNIPDNIKTDRKFSFIMRDDVLARTMKHIEEIGCFTK